MDNKTKAMIVWTPGAVLGVAALWTIVGWGGLLSILLLLIFTASLVIGAFLWHDDVDNDEY